MSNSTNPHRLTLFPGNEHDPGGSYLVEFDDGQAVTAGWANGKLVVWVGSPEQKEAALKLLQRILAGVIGAGSAAAEPKHEGEPTDAELVDSVKRNGMHATALALRVSDSTARKRFQAAQKRLSGKAWEAQA